jgi:3-methyladenine DNA glycosylase AlkD
MNLDIYEPVPRPIAPIVCACGCGHEFQPRRRDQKYLNKQHADYGYNHSKRKAKNKNKIKTNKILLKNDQILEKYFKAFKKEEAAICYITHLLAEGFDYSYYTGATEELINNQAIKIYFLYHYMFQIENKNLIKIRKR